MYRAVILFTAVGLAGGCSVYDSRFIFDPAPADVASSKPGTVDEEHARTLVSVLGVRRPLKESDLPAGVEVRLRVDNTGSYRVQFDSSTMSLFTAGLEQFPDPVRHPADAVDLGPGDSAVIDAFFAFPEGKTSQDMDLSGLSVRWTLLIDEQPVTSSTGFSRLPTGYYDRHRHRVGVGYQAYRY
jgi:hypothetical protein